MRSSKGLSAHFIGIGGIGVSALAKYYLHQGATVSGSDLVSSEITNELELLGAKIAVGPHKRASIPPETNLIIYTSAILKNNPELLYAKRRKLKARSYAEVLGEITKELKTITISGSHGKSTTAALTALVLEEGYLDPTVVVGTKVKEFGNSNFRSGRGPYFVLEADEWNRSFLNYSPHIAVVTNIDAEHLDTYKNVRAVEKTFSDYLKKVPKNGTIVANHDDSRVRKVLKGFKKKNIRWYSLASRDAQTLKKIMRVPGEHNISNALAALEVGRALGIHEPAILNALSRFNGTWRRFDFRGLVNGASIFDDYGHHPREIQATIVAARARFPLRRIWCVYQPHQYQRLAYLWDDFESAFDLADRVCLLPVYDVAGRETSSAKIAVNSRKLVQALVKRGKNAAYFASFNKATPYLTLGTRKGDIVLVMGAGNIYNLSKNLINSNIPKAQHL